jgi:hypothetical protein
MIADELILLLDDVISMLDEILSVSGKSSLPLD